MNHRVDPYEGKSARWSGNVNQVVVDELTDLQPARALDIGCGEGADAVWLASRGWKVTAVEPSATALNRARGAAELAGVHVEWLHAELAHADVATPFELVTLCYPELFANTGAERLVASLVGIGGTLLVATHADVDRERAMGHGFKPDDYIAIDSIRSVLDDAWEIVVDEVRPRHVDGGAGAHHRMDHVMKAIRRH